MERFVAELAVFCFVGLVMLVPACLVWWRQKGLPFGNTPDKKDDCQ